MRCLGITILAHISGGLVGVASGAMGMLGTTAMAITVDAYGPISDTAGGIGELDGMPEDMREKIDFLDAAGNTTTAPVLGLTSRSLV